MFTRFKWRLRLGKPLSFLVGLGLLMPLFAGAETPIDPRSLEMWIGRVGKNKVEVIRPLGTEYNKFPRSQDSQPVDPPLNIRLFRKNGASEVVTASTYEYKAGCGYPTFYFKQDSVNNDWTVALPETSVAWRVTPAKLSAVSTSHIPQPIWDSMMPLSSPTKVTPSLCKVKGLDSVLFATVDAERRPLPGTRSYEESPNSVRTASIHQLFSVDQGMIYPAESPREDAEGWTRQEGYFPLLGEFSTGTTRLLIGLSKDGRNVYYIRLHEKGYYVDSRATIPQPCAEKIAGLPH